MPNKINLIGQKFNKLMVIELTDKKTFRQRVWKCVCDCGSFAYITSHQLNKSIKTDCGCGNSERISAAHVRHGHCKNKSSTTTYVSWQNMRARCLDSTNEHFNDYGGRGISICERWVCSFDNFLADMGERPKGMTLDRVITEGDYTPTNCRWATAKQQARNRRNNILIEIRGETKCLAEWCEIYGLNPDAILNRINQLGWALDEDLFKPMRPIKTTRWQ